MDFSRTADGKLDLSSIGNGMNLATKNVPYIMKHITDKDSYVCKMFLLGIMCAGIFILYKFSMTPKRYHRRGEEYGSAKWGNKKEIKSLADNEIKPEFHPILRDGKRVFNKKGRIIGVTIDNNIIIADKLKLSLNTWQHNLNLNMFIIGDSGSGKTRFVAKPNICQLNTSYVITDPKGEILADTGKMLIEAGYKVRVFNTIQMKHSNNYNPFHYVYDPEGHLSTQDIVKMVDVLFSATKVDGEKEDFWSQKGKSLLQAIIFLLFEESEYNAEFDNEGNIIESTRDTRNLNFFAVTEKMRKLIYPPKGKPDGYTMTKNDGETDEDFAERRNKAFLCPLDKDYIELEKRKPDCLALRMYKEVRNAPEETGQSFLSSANVKTFMYNLEEVQNISCCDNIHLETIGDEKTALFIIVPATDKTFNFMVSMLYTQMFDVLANRANFKYADKGQKLPVHVRCIMDEFCNISQIPDFEGKIAFVRSANISLNVIVQTLSLFKSKYEKTWEGIIGCCSTILFIGGNEETTSKYISENLGKETIDIKNDSRTKGRQSSTSTNNQILGRELMQPNEVAGITIKECIVKMRSHNPFLCQKYNLKKHPNYAFLADAAKTDKEKAERTFQISSIHAVSVKELNQVATSSNDKSSDTAIDNNLVDISNNEIKDVVISSNDDSPEFSVIHETVLIDTSNSISPYIDALTLFERQKIRVYGDEELSNNEVEYDKVNLNIERFDLGEPIIRKEEYENEDQEQVTPDVINPDGSIDEAVATSSNDVMSEGMMNYEVTEAVTSTIEDLSSENISEAIITSSDIHTVSDDVIQDDYDMDDQFRDF
ncbi:VirD4-like conjugal transfer protein, CD1115 family [Ruminococcus sp.]|uniref:VirD4-like conjugal transfer protein, CD1115 family n=1 Tax=Ruminococcus sp. TaxID=41978 RepID=UPI0025DF6396|nr:type IV secretory system conjugative DNA transfer family protein [Ruminococcus sp.]